MRTRSVVPERESGVSVVVAAVAAASTAKPVASAAEPVAAAAAEPDYMKEYRSELCKRLLYHRFNDLHPKRRF
uniref:Uncharacterized protein n=1 Tax=Oryza rufipogon TaxID=4529 RepID=A0A0E0N8P6_ORYRU